MVKRPWIIVLSALALLAGIAFVVVSQTGPKKTIQSSPPASAALQSDRALDRFYNQDLTWRDCGLDQCTDLMVPLDYAKPDGETIKLALRRSGTGAKRTLLINPGGPGGSGVDFVGPFVARAGVKLLETYDVIGFDPRGVGRSAPVKCLSDRDFAALLRKDPTPQTRAELEESVRDYRTMGDACVKNSGDIAAHITTAEVAHDMDIMRVVFRHKKLDYYGASYGTELGATYAELYPERVGRFVLDAAVNLEASDLEYGLGQARGFQSAFDAFATWCIDSGNCVLGRNLTEASDAIVKMLDDLETRPATVAKTQRKMYQTDGFYGVAVALYNEDYWPVLKQALTQFLGNDDATALLGLSDAYLSRSGKRFTDNSAQVITAIRCLEGGEVRTLDEQLADLPKFEKASPVFGRFMAWSTSCLQWPVSTDIELPRIEAKGAAPILVIGTTNDPATPYEWSKAMAKQLDSGVLLTKKGEGHAAFGSGNKCIDGAVLGLLKRGKMPPNGKRC